jgi:hypothetical protein
VRLTAMLLFLVAINSRSQAHPFGTTYDVVRPGVGTILGTGHALLASPKTYD